MKLKIKFFSISIIAITIFNFLANNASAIILNGPSYPDYQEKSLYSTIFDSIYYPIIELMPEFIFLTLFYLPFLIIFSYFLYHKIIKGSLGPQTDMRQLFIKIIKQCLIWSFVIAILLMFVNYLSVGARDPINMFVNDLEDGRFAIIFFSFAFLPALLFLVFISGFELLFFSRVNKGFLKPALYFFLLFIILSIILVIIIAYLYSLNPSY